MNEINLKMFCVTKEVKSDPIRTNLVATEFE